MAEQENVVVEQPVVEETTVSTEGTSIITIKKLLEAGSQFGHQTKRWNPKMAPYIYAPRNGIYIIDLQKTVTCVEEAYNALKEITAKGGKTLFVGTKKQIKDIMIEEATRSGSFHVTQRWLGGTLTNFKTIRSRIRRMEEIETMEKDGTFEALPKKEVIQIKKEYDKLVKNLRGIREMKRMPQAMIIVDPRKEEIAIKEARILGIPVFGIVDTNCDPDMVDYVIPGNDDAVRSVKLIIGALTNAIAEVNGNEVIDYISEEDKNKETKKASKKEEKTEVVEVKEEVVEAKEETVDYTKMTVAELKEVAAAKEINVAGMKKAEIIEALTK